MEFQSVIRNLQLSWSTVVCSYASAAQGASHRFRRERLNHVDCSFLFVRILIAGKLVQCAKVPGSDNPADICTKGLNAQLMPKYVSAVDAMYDAGKAALCPEDLRVWRSR